MKEKRLTHHAAAWRSVVLGSALAACLLAAGAAAAAPGPRIEIKDHQFSPAMLTIPVGTTVTWTNHDDDVHTVTSSGHLFTSKGLDTDETFTYTFTKPGTYLYFCTLHPLMTGNIIVK